MKFSIRHQILLLIGINSVLIILVLYISYSGIVNINSARDNLVYKARQLNYLLVAQNMRDNVRGLIYRGFSIDRSDEKERNEIKTEFQTQLNGFIANIEELVQMNKADSLVNQINASAKEFAVFSTTLFAKEMEGDAESFIIINDFPPLYNSLVVPMNVLNANIHRNYTMLEEESNTIARASLSGIFSISIFSILGSIVISIIISNRISQRINRASNIISEVSIGKLPERNDATGSDEVGEMLKSLNNYLDSVTETVKFAVQVGKGNLNAEYNALSEHDQLGQSLLEMRNNLKKVAQEDEKRNWTLNGMAKYVEISKRESHDIESFTENVLSYLIKYLKVNQAFFYTVEERDDTEVLVLKSAYAWDKRKHRNHEIEKGNGLTGQVWQEGTMMYLKDIPDDYIKITSGLGTAAPRNLVILPLKVNEVIYGMIEIASFQDIEPHELNFLDRIAENIASTLANVQTAEKTRMLLYQSQEQTIRLNAQEEEMRQSMEEMQATQEELARKEKEYMREINRLKEELKAFGKVMKEKENEAQEEDMKDLVEEALRKQGEMSGSILTNRSLI